jgi:hypothetical protein
MLTYVYVSLSLYNLKKKKTPAKAVGFFLGKKIHSISSIRGEVKLPVPCHGFAACKRTL